MWKSRPFVWILLFFLFGILVASHLSPIQAFSPYVYLLSAALFLMFARSVSQFLKSYSLRWLPGFFSAITLFLTGISLTLFHYQSHHSPLPGINKAYISGEIISEPTVTNKAVKFILKPMFDSLQPVYSTGNIMTFLKKDTSSEHLHLGDYITVVGKLSKPSPPLNPEEFDYAFYLKTQNVNRFLFTGKNEWKKIKIIKSKSLKSLFAGWRNYLLDALQKNGLKGEEYSVAAAILLGNDQLIEPNTEQNYVAAGAVHILCVSGMHVGIIFLVLNYLLSFLNNIKRGNLIKNLLLFSLLWSYAMLTGLSPSVLRATVMISFFILANALNRDYDSYNLLAASAFFLLLFNPLFIFHVGFQLSYSAVLGILTFYKPIYRSVYFKYKFVDVFWAALVVSLSAQLGAFPIAAHYFHVFPVYFLLTNLIIFLLSYLILSLGFALLLTSWIPLIPKILGFALSFIIKILNLWVQFVAHLPFSQLKDLSFPWIKVVIIYALILFLFYFLFQKKWKFLLPALAALALLLSINLIQTLKNINQKYLMVYAVNQHTAIGLIRGKTQWILTDSAAAHQPKLLTYHLNNYRISHSLKNKLINLSTIKNSGIFRFNGKNYYLLRPALHTYPLLKRKISLFAVIYRGNQYVSLHELNKSFMYHTVILASAIPNWVKSKIQKEAKNMKINIIDVNKSGAIKIDNTQLFKTKK